MQNYIYNIKNISFKKIKNAQECFTDQEYITDINMINFGNKLTNLYFIFGGCHNLINVSNFNTINVTDMSSMFYGCESLINVPNFNTSKVTDMSGMFEYCSNLTTVPNFDTSNVTDMSSMFEQCSNLKIIPNFNTNNVTTIDYMFSDCSNLINIPNFNTSSVIIMNGIFYNCQNLINIPNFNTINVIYMRDVFQNCYSLVNIPNFNTSNVTNMEYMFSNCYNLTRVSNINTSNVKDMEYMFYNCHNLTNIPNFNVNNAIYMRNMFWNCTNLTQNTLNWIASWVPPYNQLTSPYTNSLTYFGLSNNQINIIRKNLTASNMAINNGWNIPITTNYSILYKTNINEAEWIDMGLNNILISDNAGAVRSAFINNTPNKNTVTNLKVNSLPEATNLLFLFNNMYNLQEVNELNIPEAADISYIFTNCNNLISISNFNTLNVTSMGSMFSYCKNLTTIPNFNTINVTNMEYMFYSCYNLINISNFDTSNVTNMECMFFSCSNLTTIPSFNTSRVTDTSDMFHYCNHLITIPNFNTSNVTNMMRMFHSCYNLTTIPNFNTSKVADMNGMFTWCRNLVEIPNFNTSNVVNMSSMFYNCHNLINEPNFNVSKVKDVSRMFYNCTNLINVPVFNTNNVIKIREMFNYCNNLSNNSLENIAYSIPYYSNITETSKWPMLNYIGLSETQTNNLSAAAVEFVENRGWFVQPQIKIEYTLLNGYSGNNRIFISGMSGIEQCQNLSNIIVADTQNNAVTLNILGTSSNIELINLLNYKGRYLTDLNFGINTINTTNGYRAFELCHNLKNINGLKTNNIINGYLMFSNCENLQPSWNEWNFNNVINGTQMFCNIGGFIPNFSIPNLSFANLDCATAMFRSVQSNYANITDVSSNIYMPKVTDMGLIFASCSNLSLNALQNIVTFIPDYTQLNSTTEASGWSDWDNSYYGTLQYLGLTQDQIDLLPDKYKQMAADKHWNVPGFIAREKASVLPICNNLGAISNYISNNSYTEIPMILSYKDEYEDYCLESQNQGVANSTSSAIITIPEELIALCGNEYTFTFYYSGETNYDYLTVYRNGTEIKKCNGNNGSIYLQDTLYLEDVIAGDIFQFTFRKDGSGNTGLDGCLIFITGYKGEKAYEIAYSLVEDPDTLLYKIIPKEEN